MAEQQKQNINVYDISLKPGNLDNNEGNNLLLSCKINYNNQEIPITIQFNTKNNSSQRHVIDLYNIRFNIGNNSYTLQREYTDGSKCLKITLLSLMKYYTSKNYYQLFQQNDLTRHEEALRKQCFLKNFSYHERVLTLLTFLKSCLSEINEKNDTTITNLSNLLQQDQNIHVPNIGTKNIDILAVPDFNKAVKSFKQKYNKIDDGLNKDGIDVMDKIGNKKIEQYSQNNNKQNSNITINNHQDNPNNTMNECNQKQIVSINNNKNKTNNTNEQKRTSLNNNAAERINVNNNQTSYIQSDLLNKKYNLVSNTDIEKYQQSTWDRICDKICCCKNNGNKDSIISGKIINKNASQIS